MYLFPKWKECLNAANVIKEEEMEQLVLQLYLSYGAYRDGKEKKISMGYLLLGLFLGICSLISRIVFEKEKTDYKILIFSLLPGMIFLLYHFINSEAIGMGDGLLLCILGIWCTDKVWKLWYTSLLFFSIYGIFIATIKRISIKSKIPYFPFLWLANLLYMGVGYG